MNLTSEIYLKLSVQLGIVQLSTIDAEKAKDSKIAKDEFEGEVGGQFPRKGFPNPHPSSSKWNKTPVHMMG